MVATLSGAGATPTATPAGVMPREVAALFVPIANARVEIAMFGYFDPEWRLLGMRHIAPGLTDTVAISLRDVVADVLAFDCAVVVMAHNHPSGDPSPSEADYAVTRRLARTLDAIEVQLFDHIVLTRDGRESFRARGLL